MSETNILEKITTYKKELVEKQKKELPVEAIKDAIANFAPTVSIKRKFQEAIVQGRMALIAEVKKASPSKGLIREDFNPVEIAKIYASSNASAISVLTDERFFQGSLEYLKDVVSNVKLPVLRKDFIIDPYQIYQSRYYGADWILLISSILTKEQLLEYHDIAESIGLSCLVETHSEEEFDYHLERKTPIIGINNRDLKTFVTDINHTLKLVKDKELCKSFIISESGIDNYNDIMKLSNANISGVLVGERFMREQDIALAIKKLFQPE
ncbi:MAG: indole-3-glycerol phosphate synthase TrpC [Vampirovibrionia bacterium]